MKIKVLKNVVHKFNDKYWIMMQESLENPMDIEMYISDPINYGSWLYCKTYNYEKVTKKQMNYNGRNFIWDEFVIAGTIKHFLKHINEYIDLYQNKIEE